ncbi:Cytochrome c family protein [hydrothermal vent metagenome]|uniref:Cytochrome c family protein n=1 Tax=hydrothermal vent metagenome TaxID=652676 RepID=A0A3B1CYZ3_9ZZZZ
MALIATLGVSTAFAQWDPTSKASNLGSIVNTRHNMTQSYIGSSGMAGFMDYSRNNYAEVCVYCHTPHGSNSTINAPLWNRTNKTTTYTLYSKQLTSGQTPTQPGLNSLTCLSCHDGTVAIDSIINMPTTQTTAYGGNYSAGQETTQNNTFLDAWTNPSGIAVNDHGTLWNSASGYFSGPYNCNRCHTQGNVWGIPDFAPFLVGTDLSNDHPVGVQLPDPAVYDFNATTGIDGSLKFYDTNTNGRADTNEVRLYDTGDGYEVECASCHDPHGAPSAGPGSARIASFLRVDNTGSTLCLTCHDK